MVLNAFRHHRGRHKPILVIDLRVIECSTPFGITEVGTYWNYFDAARESVLNAFRHHRGRHTAEKVGDFLREKVLNAFRHHRGRHATTRRGLAFSPLCSTPFGITEVGTVSFLGPLAYLIVLNAFRHHRGRHSCRDNRVRTRELLCSTPFGITEVGTRAADQ